MKEFSIHTTTCFGKEYKFRDMTSGKAGAKLIRCAVDQLSLDKKLELALWHYCLRNID